MRATRSIPISICGMSFLSAHVCFALSEQDIEDRYGVIFDEDYKKNLPPVTIVNDSIIPVDVWMDLEILRNPIVREEEQEIIMNVIIGLYWDEHRLHNRELDEIIAPPDVMNRMWLPQVIFRPLKDLKYTNGMSDSRRVRIFRDGRTSFIEYCISCSLELICEMEFDSYPMDVQMCKWEIQTTTTVTLVNLTWDYRGAISIKGNEWGENDLELPNFKFRFETGQDEDNETLYLQMFLRRGLSTHLLMTYLPSGLLVIVSWCSFIIDPNMVPGRVALILTALLTLVTMFSSLRQKLQPSFDVKPVEVWIMVCMSFVVAALLEYALILCRVRCNVLGKKQKIEPIRPFILYLKKKKVMKGKRCKCFNARGKCSHAFANLLQRGGCLDVISLFLFPLAFTAFNAYYWISHLTNMNKTWKEFISDEQED